MAASLAPSPFSTRAEQADYQRHFGHAWALTTVAEATLERIGRDPGELTLACLIHLSMDSDADRALQTVREHLSQRYTGGPYPNPKIDRLIVRIDPERVTGFESGQPWDVTG